MLAPTSAHPSQLLISPITSLTHVAFVQELLSKLSGAGIQGPEAATLTQEANALFTSALTLLSQFVPLHLKMFHPSPSPSQMPQPYDDPEILYGELPQCA